jgi:hypothetical protein
MFLGSDINDGTDWYIAVAGQVGTSGNLGWHTALYDGQDNPQSTSIPPRAPPIFYQGASNGDDVPCAIQEIIDSADNKYHLFVTGRSWSSVSGDDWQTHRYRFDP